MTTTKFKPRKAVKVYSSKKPRNTDIIHIFPEQSVHEVVAAYVRAYYSKDGLTYCLHYRTNAPVEERKRVFTALKANGYEPIREEDTCLHDEQLFKMFHGLPVNAGITASCVYAKNGYTKGGGDMLYAFGARQLFN